MIEAEYALDTGTELIGPLKIREANKQATAIRKRKRNGKRISVQVRKLLASLPEDPHVLS